MIPQPYLYSPPKVKSVKYIEETKICKEKEVNDNMENKMKDFESLFN